MMISSRKSSLAILLVANLWIPFAVSGQDERVQRKSAVVDLCAALEAVSPGDRLPIVVQAMYSRSGRIWDPFEPMCGGKAQPVTFVEMGPGAEIPLDLKNLLEKDGKAFASFTGILFGAPRPNPDNLELAPALAYVNRVQLPRTYFRSYETKLLVEEITNVWPADQLESPRFFVRARSPFPVVRRSALPSSYPWMAANLHVYGDVVVEVDLKMGNVFTTKVISAADRLLIEDTLANIKTWEFDPDAEATFTTTFSYRFEDLPSTTPAIRVHTELPVRVEIIAPRNKW